jgi:transcriptional regulator with XRE-family HTH domain
MITGAQVRGARGILDWSADVLAEKTGLSVDTIRNIEKGRVQGHNTSLEKIVQVFGNSGLEFIENQGVRFKPTGVTIYDGVAAFEDFHDFLYQHLKQNGGDVCLSIYDEPLLAKYRKDPEIHRSRMRELVDSGKVTFRLLTTKSSWDTRGYIQFKWLPNQRPVPTGFYAFGDCLALVSFVNPQSPYVVVLQSGPITEAYRQGFDIAWESAEPPPSEETN